MILYEQVLSLELKVAPNASDVCSMNIAKTVFKRENIYLLGNGYQLQFDNSWVKTNCRNINTLYKN